MLRVASLFSQLLQLFPRTEFEALVNKHKANRNEKGFTCWGQFVAMLFCQLGRAQSLREICGGLAASEGKLKHLGVPSAPNRSTLSYANAHRPWELYRSVFEQLYQRCQQVSAQHGKRRFRFRNKLLSLDATMVECCASLMDWAFYQRSKGAVKLHLLLDHDGLMPAFAVLTDGKTQEITVARQMRFPRGAILVFDKAYTQYDWWRELTEQGVYFVSRLRDNTRYTIFESRPLPAKTRVLTDELIVVDQQLQPGVRPYLRRIEVLLDDMKTTMVFVTNHLRLSANTVAAIYKDRWQIELFFKSLKQTLRIKTFVGTTPNAVQVQIWTALIAMLVLRWLKLKARFAWSLSNLVALLRQQLFVYRDLWTWLDSPFQPPPALLATPVQLNLGFPLLDSTTAQGG